MPGLQEEKESEEMPQLRRRSHGRRENFNQKLNQIDCTVNTLEDKVSYAQKCLKDAQNKVKSLEGQVRCVCGAVHDAS